MLSDILYPFMRKTSNGTSWHLTQLVSCCAESKKPLNRSAFTSWGSCPTVSTSMKIHYKLPLTQFDFLVDSSWNVTAHGDAQEGKWRGNWRMEWVASTLHTVSEHGVSSIITGDAHTSAASSRLNWRPRRFKWTLSISPKDETWFLRVCHHISTGLYLIARQCHNQASEPAATVTEERQFVWLSYWPVLGV